MAGFEDHIQTGKHMDGRAVGKAVLAVGDRDEPELLDQESTVLDAHTRYQEKGHYGAVLP